MTKAPREGFPIVTYEIQPVRGRGGLGFGWLIETPDGRSWCFPCGETAERFPDAGAFEIDRARLKVQPDSEIGRRHYVYRPQA